LGAGAHGMNDDGVVSVDAEHADLRQSAIARTTDAHRELVIKLPLRDGIPDSVRHLFVGDVVLPGGRRNTLGDKAFCQERLSIPTARGPACARLLARVLSVLAE
jgi:hypothetical protein